MNPRNPLIHIAILFLTAALWLPASAVRADDTVLFTAAVAPNVLLHVDNSGSMNHIVWHEEYDPDVASVCTRFNDTSSYSYSSNYSPNYGSYAGCENATRTIWVDTDIPDRTRWSGHYLNWYFSAAATSYISEIALTNNGTLSTCLGGGTFSKYRRSRVTAAKQILSDVICQVNQTGEVRFGLSKFRLGSDPRGGYVRVGIDDYTSSHATALANAISELEGETWTPLAESLYQIYSYFMERDSGATPDGANSNVF
ncbi:MAG: hypothetical protein JRG83_17495, partial [Deltaproteobacteria bacterium]|nr:hypothetical protein [Deltaproteobacteria bacterium]